MSRFAVTLARRDGRWSGAETDLSECESLADLADVLRDVRGEVRLLLVEQDDEYATVVRVDADDDDPRVFLSDGHAADAYPLAAFVAEELIEIGGDELAEEDDAPPAHDSAPFGDPDLLEDLGTPAADLLAMCAHAGTLPVDLLLAVCEKAGCGEIFEDLRG